MALSPPATLACPFFLDTLEATRHGANRDLKFGLIMFRLPFSLQEIIRSGSRWVHRSPAKHRFKSTRVNHRSLSPFIARSGFIGSDASAIFARETKRKISHPREADSRELANSRECTRTGDASKSRKLVELWCPRSRYRNNDGEGGNRSRRSQYPLSRTKAISFSPYPPDPWDTIRP